MICLVIYYLFFFVTLEKNGNCISISKLISENVCQWMMMIGRPDGCIRMPDMAEVVQSAWQWQHSDGANRFANTSGGGVGTQKK